MKYSYFDSIKSKRCRQISVAELMDIIKSPRVVELCKGIREALEQGDDKRASQLKSQLPVIVLGQLYEDGQPRSKDGGKPTGALMIDYDNCKTEEEAKALMQSIKEKWLGDIMLQDLILAVHYSPRLHGVHIWYRWVDGCKSYAECNDRIAKLLGQMDYDEACKDNSRCSFLVPYEYFEILNLDGMEKNEEYAAKVPQPPKGEAIQMVGGRVGQNESNRTSQADALPLRGSGGQSKQEDTPSGCPPPSGVGGPYPTTYEGIPYSDIIAALTRKCAPAKHLDENGYVGHGARNVTWFKVACLLRYICDNNEEWLCAVAPKWALDHDVSQPGKLHEAARNACKRNLSFSFPKTLTAALNECGVKESNAMEQTQNQADPELDNEAAQREYEGIEASKQKFLMFPAVVPPIFQEFCDGVKPEWKAAVVLTLLPTLGTCMSKLRARYLDNRLHSPSFQTVIEAKMASGKQNYADIAEFILAPITALDLEGNTQLNLYNAEVVKANNSKTLSSPPDVCVRKMIGRFTEAGLNSTLDTSKGLHIWSGVSEIDEVADVWKQLSYILRLAYDNSPYGRTLQSQRQFRGERNLFLNTFLCGTPNAVGRVYQNPEDGLVSRTIFYKQMVETQGIPLTKVSSPTKARLSALIQKIHDQYCIRKQGEDFVVALEQEVGLDYVNKHLSKWLERKALEAAKYGSEAIERFRRRDACNGFRAGMVAHAIYLAIGKKMTNKERNVVKGFAEWVAEYSLMMHDYKFGAELNRILAADELQSSTSHIDILSALPDTFTLAEAYKVFPYETTGAVRNKLKRLVEKNMLAKEGRALYIKIN